jgi:hypothetical protein
MNVALETNPTWHDLMVHADSVDKLDLLKRWAPRMLRVPGGASAIPDEEPIHREQAREILAHIGIYCDISDSTPVADQIFSASELEAELEVITESKDSPKPIREISYDNEIETSCLSALVVPVAPASRSNSVSRVDDIIDTIEHPRESLTTRNVLGITVKSEDEAVRIHDYINGEIKHFFDDVVKEAPTGYIPYQLSIAPASDLRIVSSFMSGNEQRDWVYDQLFHDFGERDQGGKLVRKLKFFVTLDEASAPILIKHQGQRGADDRRYGTIDVGGGTLKEHRVCYIVYFTLQELLNVMKQK